MERIRNIGFIAHIDAGKTTVTERVLFAAGRTYKMGNVDAGTATMDWMDQEKERGITITAAAATCQWNDYRINIIDTPGHVDFTAEVERSLRVLDGGVVIFDAVAGVQPQSETVWRQADRYHVPRICFVNKMDRVGANFVRTVDMIRHRLKAKPVPIQIPMGSNSTFEGVIDLMEGNALTFSGDISQPPGVSPVPEKYREGFLQYRDAMVERIAETDEALLIKYLEGEAISTEELRAALRRATISNSLVPVLCGTALKNQGIQPLLDAVTYFLPSPADVPPVHGLHPKTGGEEVRKATNEEPFSALAFKVMIDSYTGRLVYMRVYSGTARGGDMVYNATKGQRERMGRLMMMMANRREDVEEIHAGDIVAAVGLKNTFTGDTLCSESEPVILEAIRFPEPVLSVAVEPKSKADQEKLADALIKLGEEDPTFRVRYDQETGQTLISGMGELHLEVVVERMRREFNVQANVGRPRVAYREAITAPARAEGRLVRQTGGHGQYGHVWLEVEPLERGTGFVFENKIVGGKIPREYIPGVEQGAKGAMEAGVVAGYPVIDVKVTLVDGSYHEVDSSDMAFRIAASMGMKEALRRAKPVLLEPIMAIEVVMPGDFLGEILGDLSSRRAHIRNMEGVGDTQVVTAHVPLSEMFGYATQIRSLTQGRANYTMVFDNYAEVPEHIASEVMHKQ
ncbi:MAG: elongation factor G [Dehalococcoidia bacterium]|nr:elongation factor G [Dehalococcoidia bacterium]